VVTAAQVYESMARSSTTRVERAPALDRLLAQTTRHVHAALDVPLQALADDADRAAADAEAVPAGESKAAS
jgi:hypothetical protein